MPSFDWGSEIRPALVAIYDVIKKSESGQPDVGTEQILEQLECGEDYEASLDAILGRLQETGYIKGQRTMTGWCLIQLQHQGLIEVAGWPARSGQDYGAMLMDALERRISETEDQTERTKLEKFRDEIATVGRGVVTAVLADVASGGL